MQWVDFASSDLLSVAIYVIMTLAVCTAVVLVCIATTGYVFFLGATYPVVVFY